VKLRPPAGAPWPAEEGEPVFNEPWEAQAFGLAVQLSEAGHFTWPEWADVLSEEIKAAQEGGDPDTGSNYYHHWLRALERICAEKNLAVEREVETRAEEWRKAYVNTPHGQPVELSAAEK
jgi:nitrile hydratase accessory protein